VLTFLDHIMFLLRSEFSMAGLGFLHYGHCCSSCCFWFLSFSMPIHSDLLSHVVCSIVNLPALMLILVPNFLLTVNLNLVLVFILVSLVRFNILPLVVLKYLLMFNKLVYTCMILVFPTIIMSNAFFVIWKELLIIVFISTILLLLGWQHTLMQVVHILVDPHPDFVFFLVTIWFTGPRKYRLWPHARQMKLSIASGTRCCWHYFAPSIIIEVASTSRTCYCCLLWQHIRSLHV
jgi:hypothetical protein